MSDNDGAAARQDGAGARDDIGAADEQALRAMFAALVEDAEPSELSPLEVQRQGRNEQRSARDRRSKRIGYTRNALIAAVVIGVIALVAPQLRNSSDTAASSTSASAPAAAFSAAGGASAASSAADGSASRSFAAAAAPAASATAGA